MQYVTTKEKRKKKNHVYKYIRTRENTLNVFRFLFLLFFCFFLSLCYISYDDCSHLLEVPIHVCNVDHI